MKTSIHKFVVFTLILIISITMPQFAAAQERLVGELVITKNSAEGFVSINGERVVNGRSITSPSEIVTSPQASAKVVLAQTGAVLISPNSKLNLSFINSSISGDLLSGEITIETVPNTTLNLLTVDGTITLPAQNQVNIVKVSVIDNNARVQTLTGQARFNNVLVPAGEFYPLSTDDRTNADTAAVDNSDDSKGFNPLLIIGIVGAVAGVALIALTTSSNNGSSNTSPTR